MSFILRHGAEREGLKLDENGYARVDELVCFNLISILDVSLHVLPMFVPIVFPNSLLFAKIICGYSWRYISLARFYVLTI